MDNGEISNTVYLLQSHYNDNKVPQINTVTELTHSVCFFYWSDYTNQKQLVKQQTECV